MNKAIKLVTEIIQWNLNSGHNHLGILQWKFCEKSEQIFKVCLFQVDSSLTGTCALKTGSEMILYN